MNIEKIKDVTEALFTFIQYTLTIIFSVIAGISILFILPLFIAMIGGYPHAFAGFWISFGSLLISIIILDHLDVEEFEDMPTIF